MNKNELLGALAVAFANKEITKDEIDALMTSSVASGGDVKKQRSVNIATVLYYVGALIVLIGIFIFVTQKWDELTSFARILVTLGAGVGLFVSGLFLEYSKKLDRIPTALQVIAGLLIPTGVFVTLYELGFYGGEWGPGFIFLFFTIAYVLTYRYYQKIIFVLFSIVYGTTAFFLLSNSLVGGAPVFNETKFYLYRFLGVGLAYIFFAYGFKMSPLARLRGGLYAIGSLCLFVAVISLGGWQPEQNVFWELICPLLTFGGMYFSLELRSRSMLYISAVALVSYLIKITNEYFSDTLSWSLLLILSGVVIIGVGYLTYYLSDKYLSVKA